MGNYFVAVVCVLIAWDNLLSVGICQWGGVPLRLHIKASPVMSQDVQIIMSPKTAIMSPKTAIMSPKTAITSEKLLGIFLFQLCHF